MRRGVFLFLVTFAHTMVWMTSCCHSSSPPKQPKGVVKSDIGMEEDEENDGDETEEDIDEEDFSMICDSHVVPERVKEKPKVIIIGSKKGGTRALIEFLKLHPRIKASGPEIHYFDRNYEKGLEWYLSKLRAVLPNSGEIAVEKTPGYFHTLQVPARIKQMDPETKLLLIVRDPVKRLISDYNQYRTRYLSQGKDYPTLEELLFDEDDSINTDYPVLQRSIYHMHMKRWLQHFPVDQIHIVNGEEFIKAPWKELQEVEQFLNLTTVINQDHFFFNGTKGFYCVRDQKTFTAWKCTREKCLGKSKGRPKPPVHEDTVKRLVEFFMPHNRKFYNMVQKEFGWRAA